VTRVAFTPPPEIRNRLHKSPMSTFHVSVAASWLAAFLVAACSPSPESAAAPASSAASSVAGAPSAPRVELTIYAATSTRDALAAIESAYERDHPVDLMFNFGGSGDLAKQIVAAGKADVFLSAGAKEMDEVETAKLVVAGTRRDLLANQLVVIEPTGGASMFAVPVFGEPFDPRSLSDARVARLSLANTETVPAGRYAKAWLQKVGVWDSVATRVLPGVDVRAALAAVESGGAQAGIVYRTDVARSKAARVVHAVPISDGPRIVYPVAVVSGRPHEARAREFVLYLASDAARGAFESAGFVVPVPGPVPEPAGSPR